MSENKLRGIILSKYRSMTTVMELQQTTVDGLKATHYDGKLTRDEICELNAKLLNMTREKMSNSVICLLNAAGVDINSYILGVGEEVIKNKNCFYKIRGECLTKSSTPSYSSDLLITNIPITTVKWFVLAECCGDGGIRTLDLSDANRTLSQLSYAPKAL